ncbi:MAG: alanine--tRNA ligase [Planctomycetes bacterium]|nr:alanine--tRNA ligase [Planctomycetota bacterium]
MPAAEIRERFLSFFEKRGHARYPSDSLVPTDDPTLLFTGAGMNQFKDMFLGRGALPDKRITTSQKCLRVPDLENVGRTPRHHTFFEMLGNFSFGDYFKTECIRWEWEFFTEELGIDPAALVVTVYRDDDEAAAIWRDEIGLDESRIFRFGEKENFWPAEAPSKGPNGPCGPCSEIYFDNAPGEPYPNREGLTELPDDRFTEIGNCVFTQFDRRDGGELAPLPQKNIDVGLGLERITAVLAGAPNNFETDLFRPFLEHLEAKSGKCYGADSADDIRMRRISDHVRAVTFCICDGALPSNEGRGYVVRKILRRAARDGFDLGLKPGFLADMVDVVAATMGEAYPEMRAHAAQARSLIRSEEESFGTVYRQGVQRLNAYLDGLPAASRHGGEPLAGSGEFAFQLHDTFGFPADITRAALADVGVVLDESEFEAAMSAQRDRARAAAATSDAVFATNAAMSLRDKRVATTTFTGYETLGGEAKVLALVGADDELVERVEAGAICRIVVDSTPFYAQGGGQVGDRGACVAPSGSAAVDSTASLDGYYLHTATVESGHLSVGDKVSLAVDEAARRATERNHTATHLLHAALKQVLGGHVSQAGSEVSPDRLRFDYTHGERLTDEQLEEIEDRVNAVIMTAEPVVARVQALENARRDGFVAMFGEKYGAEVRTLSVGEFSKELCGGTHVRNSGNIGAFRIVADQAISAGTRRIEAITGQRALAAARLERHQLAGIANLLKVPVDEVGARVGALVDESKKLRKELAKATAADVGKVLDDLLAAAVDHGSWRSVVFEAKGLQMNELQDLLARAKQKLDPFAGVVFVPNDGEVLVAAGVTKDLTERVNAGNVVKEIAGLLGGGGGGRAEMAQGKGRDASKLAAARERAAAMLAEGG